MLQSAQSQWAAMHQRNRADGTNPEIDFQATASTVFAVADLECDCHLVVLVQLFVETFARVCLEPHSVRGGKAAQQKAHNSENDSRKDTHRHDGTRSGTEVWYARLGYCGGRPSSGSLASETCSSEPSRTSLRPPSTSPCCLELSNPWLHIILFHLQCPHHWLVWQHFNSK